MILYIHKANGNDSGFSGRWHSCPNAGGNSKLSVLPSSSYINSGHFAISSERKRCDLLIGNEVRFGNLSRVAKRMFSVDLGPEQESLCFIFN